MVAGVIQGFLLQPALDALNSAYSVVNAAPPPGSPADEVETQRGAPIPPSRGTRSASKAATSSVRAPRSGADLRFNGTRAKEPIASTSGSIPPIAQGARRPRPRRARPDQRWKRTVFAVFTTTGTGWVDAAGRPGRVHPQRGHRARGDAVLLPPELDLVPRRREKAADTGPR